jgi:2-oxoglutarate dehydrogenase E2 component (dihydrolipoamide succinyltransferase)
MATEITIPSVGESITEASIVRWLKKDGELVQQGEPLVELETEKASTELPAPATGKLRIRAEEGKTLAVGEAIGTIEESSEVKKSAKPTPPKKKNGEERTGEKKEAKEDKTKEKEKDNREKDEEEEAPAKAPLAAPARQPPALSPSARRLARERARAQVAPPSFEQHKIEVPAVDGQKREPMSPIRRRVAQRLLASQKNAATLTTFNEADLSAIQELRARYRESFREKHGVSLGLVYLFVKCCVTALQAHPIVNARIDGDDIVYHDHCNIGVAVSTEKSLMVPVLHRAEQMNLVQIEKTIEDLAEKARAGKISIHDLEGGTFTITNGGVFGSLLSTPILNPPQSAILGMHVIQKRPVVVNDEIVIRPMMYLASSYDHRLIDGQDAVQFLVDLRKLVEAPVLMLLET